MRVNGGMFWTKIAFFLFALAINFSPLANAAGKYRVFFEHSPTFQKKVKTEVSLDKPFETISIWASHESTCKCLAEVVNEPVPTWFNFSCTLPNDYRVQVNVKCARHTGEKEALTMFICQNFKIWCEEKSK